MYLRIIVDNYYLYYYLCDEIKPFYSIFYRLSKYLFTL